MNSKSSKSIYRLIGWFVSIIFFLIGFFHTGLGLQEYKIFGMKYGSFILAFGILMLIVLSYAKAVEGSKSALFFYLLFAMVTFVCNLNSFYPNYMANKLLLDELEEKKNGVESFASSIKATFEDEKAKNTIAQVIAKKEQLIAQILNGGFSDKSKKVLDQITTLLGIPSSQEATALTKGNTLIEWEDRATIYGSMVDKMVNAFLVSRNVGDKQSIISASDSLMKLKVPMINAALQNQIGLQQGPTLIKSVVQDQNSICKKALTVSKNEKVAFECKDIYFENADLGRFTHTFSSVKKHTNEFGTWLVIAICLLIDFIIPIAMYFLIRKKESDLSTINQPDSFWDKLFKGKKSPKAF